MNFSSIINQIRGGLSLVQNLGFLEGTPIMTAVNVGAALLQLAEELQERVKEGLIVASSDDQEALKAIIADIQKENDLLAIRIANS